MRRHYLKTSDVVLESRGWGTRWEFLAGSSSSVCAMEMWWCNEACESKKEKKPNNLTLHIASMKIHREQIYPELSQDSWQFSAEPTRTCLELRLFKKHAEFHSISVREEVMREITWGMSVFLFAFQQHSILILQTLPFRRPTPENQTHHGLRCPTRTQHSLPLALCCHAFWIALVFVSGVRFVH